MVGGLVYHCIKKVELDVPGGYDMSDINEIILHASQYTNDATVNMYVFASPSRIRFGAVADPLRQGRSQYVFHVSIFSVIVFVILKYNIY